VSSIHKINVLLNNEAMTEQQEVIAIATKFKRMVKRHNRFA